MTPIQRLVVAPHICQVELSSETQYKRIITTASNQAKTTATEVLIHWPNWPPCKGARGGNGGRRLCPTQPVALIWRQWPSSTPAAAHIHARQLQIGTQGNGTF